MMAVLVFMIPLALALGFIGLMAFVWSLRNGQYDDEQGAARRILSDDDLKQADMGHDAHH